MKQVKTEIIAVGTELLLGQIANTNAQWISQQLALSGINVFYHSVVGDNLKRVEEQFLLASNRSDVIIITGGLGPTDDDLTREAFQRISNLDIVEHTTTMEKIDSYFKKQNRQMTPNNRKQARVFSGATVIDNHVGMAPGMIVSHKNKTWIFLPGVPREMKRMVTDQVLPHVLQLTGENMVIESVMMMFIGIGESTLEYELRDIIRSQTNPTIAPLAQNEGVAIRLTAKTDTIEHARRLIESTKKHILERVGTYFYGIDHQSLEGKIVTMLKAQGKRLGAAESLTGGMFTEKLISVEGASEICPGGIVCYDEEVKRNILKISTDTIKNKGTISKECADEMATNICDVLNTDIGISFTGVAGPNTVEGHPTGTVYIAINDAGTKTVESFFFPGDRQTVRKKAVLKGFELLFQRLKSTN